MQSELESRIHSILEATFHETLKRVRGEVPEQLQAAIRQELESTVAEARDAALRAGRLEMAESLRDAVRRVRSEDSVTGIAAALVEAASRFASRTALFIHKEGRLLGFRTGGAVSEEQRAAFERIEIPLGEAAAFARAIEGRHAVLSSAEAGKVSSAIVSLLALEADDQVRLFPIVLREHVLAVLLADDHEEGKAVGPAAIELLIAAAEAWIEAVGARGKKPHKRAAAAASA